MNIFNKIARFKSPGLKPLQSHSHGKGLELLLVSNIKKDVVQGLSCVNHFLRAFNHHCVKTQNCCTTIATENSNRQKYRTKYQTCTKLSKGPRNSLALADVMNLKNTKNRAKPSRHTRKFTVIRSPFVFKKTREQFGLTKHGITLKFNLNGHEQNLLIHYLSLLRLPCECKIKTLA
jgi:ribosomal protein S10